MLDMINSIFNKPFYRSWTFWGAFIWGAVHGGISEALAQGYDVGELLMTVDGVAKWLGPILMGFGIRRASNPIKRK